MDFNKCVIYVLDNEELNDQEYLMMESMIRASNKAELNLRKLFDTYEKDGLMTVYNLGMKHMYEYLKGEDDEETV